MPPARAKPSDIAAEAKKTYIPYVEKMLPQFPASSFVHADSSLIPVDAELRGKERLRVAVIDGDPVDVALDWHEANVNGAGHTSSGQNGATTAPPSRIALVNMANEKRAGGDWESGLLAPEECLCRRSNLIVALHTVHHDALRPHYPLPPRGGLYSPFVVVFRSGPEYYEVWSEFKPIPVISVSPVRRPKLDASGDRYAFEQEKELMQEKIRTILRLAARHRHKDLCLGAFGVGPHFRNPVGQVAIMWREVLFDEPEFSGVFANVVFGIEKGQVSGSNDSPTDFDVFKHEFNPSRILRTA
ncbi:MAG: hypothetical protein M1838_005738 [Thelocarpon superellum]|nr:MAG: hypothetical protein M1838_005738 [Thelocarpon superellum]